MTAAAGTSRLGGRWAVSARVYWASAPIIIGFGLLTENGALDSWRSLITWAVIQALGWLAVGLVLWAADRTVLRNRRERPVPAWVVAAVGAVAGVARGLVMALLVEAWGITSGNPPQARLVMGAVLGAFWLAGVAKIMADLEDVRTEYRALLAAQVANHRRLQITERERADLAAALSAQISAQLATSLDAGADAGTMPDGDLRTPPNNLAEVAQRLERLAGPLREVSHRLWQQEAQVPVASDAQLLKYAMTGAVVRPRWSLAFFTVFGVFALGRTHGWVEGVVVAATYAISVLIAARVLNAFASSGRHSAKKLIVVSVIAAVLVPLPFVAVMVAFGLPTTSVLADWAASLMYTVLVIPLASSVLSPLNRRRIALAAMREQVTEDDLRTLALAHEHASMCRELARHLHGTVQADLYAASLRLSAGLDPGAAGSWGAVRTDQDLAALVTERFGYVPPTAESMLAPHLERLVGQWQGIVDIDVHMSPDAASAQVGARMCQDVAQMLTEVIHDALHHGAASHIRLAVSVDEEAVRVVAEDDGSPADSAGGPGLGSQLLDHGTSQWSRQPRPDGEGTLVRLVIPRAPAAGTDPADYAKPRSASS